jgi:hypothetical protein
MVMDERLDTGPNTESNEKDKGERSRRIFLLAQLSYLFEKFLASFEP